MITYLTTLKKIHECRDINYAVINDVVRYAVLSKLTFLETRQKIQLYKCQLLTKRVVQGYSRDARLADFVKREFRKSFVVIRDLKVLRDPRRRPDYHSILRDFETRALRMVRLAELSRVT